MGKFLSLHQPSGNLPSNDVRSTFDRGECLHLSDFINRTLQRVIRYLRRIGCPTLMVELLFLMYRFIFVLLATAQEIWIAQQARGGYRTRQVC